MFRILLVWLLSKAYPHSVCQEAPLSETVCLLFEFKGNTAYVLKITSVSWKRFSMQDCYRELLQGQALGAPSHLFSVLGQMKNWNIYWFRILPTEWRHVKNLSACGSRGFGKPALGSTVLSKCYNAWNYSWCLLGKAGQKRSVFHPRWEVSRHV